MDKNHSPKSKAVKVEAYVIPGIKDLFVNKDPYGVLPGWVVTHRQSGLCLTYRFDKRKKAVELMREICDLTDWSLPVDEIKDRNPVLWTQVHEIADEIGGYKRISNPIKRAAIPKTKKKKKRRGL